MNEEIRERLSCFASKEGYVLWDSHTRKNQIYKRERDVKRLYLMKTCFRIQVKDLTEDRWVDVYGHSYKKLRVGVVSYKDVFYVLKVKGWKNEILC